MAGTSFSPVPLAAHVSASNDHNQVLFYANSGPPYPSTDVSGASSSGYVSLFLSCEVRRSYLRHGMMSSGWRSALSGREGCSVQWKVRISAGLFSRPADLLIPFRWVREGLFRFTFELHRSSFPSSRSETSDTQLFFFQLEEERVI